MQPHRPLGYNTSVHYLPTEVHKWRIAKILSHILFISFPSVSNHISASAFEVSYDCALFAKKGFWRNKKLVTEVMHRILLLTARRSKRRVMRLTMVTEFLLLSMDCRYLSNPLSFSWSVMVHDITKLYSVLLLLFVLRVLTLKNMKSKINK